MTTTFAALVALSLSSAAIPLEAIRMFSPVVLRIEIPVVVVPVSPDICLIIDVKVP